MQSGTLVCVQMPTTGPPAYIVSVSAHGCSELAPHNGSAECEGRAQAGMAVFAIVAVVVMVVLWVWSRRRWKQFDERHEAEEAPEDPSSDTT